MVAMKEVLPKCVHFLVAAFRLIPAGFLLVGFALVDAACFQGFLTEGLQRTSAGLGSPLTVAVLAALLFGESIGIVGVVGLELSVIGLVLLELPALSFDESNFSLWGSGEWWTLLAAQSMAVGTVMVRWASKYSDLQSNTSFKEQNAHCHGSAGKELSKLVAFVKGTQFDLVEYLQRERYGSARLENFASGLELIRQKV